MTKQDTQKSGVTGGSRRKKKKVSNKTACSGTCTDDVSTGTEVLRAGQRSHVGVLPTRHLAEMAGGGGKKNRRIIKKVYEYRYLVRKCVTYLPT